jgi:hypothetical protein
MGVVRDRMGRLGDPFFSIVFFGSGLLFLAMTEYRVLDAQTKETMQ